MLKGNNLPVLITGGAGFAGQYLAEKLSASGRRVHLLDRMPASPGQEDPDGSGSFYHAADLTRAEGLSNLLASIRPIEIYHLAGRANVKHSWQSEAETYMVNVIGAINLMCAVRDADLKSDILIISSGEVYGLVPEDRQPVAESWPAVPRSPYAASKLCQEIACRQISRTIKGKTIFARPFNHIGPGQKQGFVTADFACQIAKIERNLQDPVIHVGNLEARRDFTDVRDTVSGYMHALTHGQNGDVINVCSGKAFSVQQVLEYMISKSTADISIRIDPARFRPSDIPSLTGSYDYLTRLSGWKPERTIEHTLDEILDYWRHSQALEETTRS